MIEVPPTRPQPTEYAAYYEKYVALVPEGDVVAALSRQFDETIALLRGLSEAQGDSRYAPEKWSVKELLGHVIDSERIFGHRAFCFARNDRAALPGFDQDDYVRNGDFDERRLGDLVEEFEQVRKGNLLLFRSLSEAAWLRRGIANDSEVSVRALAYIMAGHELHHRQILRTKYL